MKKKLLLPFLLTALFLNAMEESYDESLEATEITIEKSLEDLGLLNQNVDQYFKACFDISILDQANDIYSAIVLIEEYFVKCHDEILLNCKTPAPKEQLLKIKETIRKLYIPHLNQKFLEKRDGQEGLYPINSKWFNDPHINDAIAQFVSTGDMLDDYLLLKLVYGNYSYTEPINPSLINLLLFYGINPNTQNTTQYGRTPLHCIIRFGIPSPAREKIAKLLLCYSANPNIQDNRGETSLHDAVAEDYIEITKFLLQNNAYPNILDNKGNTPLHFAIGSNRSIVILLLQYGANPLIKNKQGQTAFDIAHEKNFTDFSELAEKYSSGLKNICLRFIVTNLSEFEENLDILPSELREAINDQKSEYIRFMVVD